MVLNTLESLKHVDQNGNSQDNVVIANIELASIIWFSLEYILRAISSPDKAQFFKDGMNLIDVLSILPYYFSLLTETSVDETDIIATEYPLINHTMVITEVAEEDERTSGFQQVLQIFRMFKLARVFKLARHFTGLMAILFTLKTSYKELSLLITFVMIVGLVFASLCYMAEKDMNDTGYTSIPASFWWAIITMTTGTACLVLFGTV